MKKYLEKSGKTEDKAIAAALAELGLERDDVSVEIVARAKSGFLGIGSSPAVVRFVGADSVQAALNYTRDMYEITQGLNSQLTIPNMDFKGAPMGIDIRKVVETGITPVINTGMAHKKPGVGQVGAGIVRAPMECFTQALEAFAQAQGL